MDGQQRDVSMICLPRWGRVLKNDGVVPWLVVDSAGVTVEPIRRFLADFVARGNRAASVRSYAFDLLRWWRWLIAIDVEWDRATSAEVRDLVLWLGLAKKLRNSARTTSVATAGSVNPLTRKRYLGDHYGPRTVRHSNAVLRSFYDFWLDAGIGLVNPVPFIRGGSRSHRSPLELPRYERRLRYNPKIPKRTPRAMSDDQWTDLFSALRSNRDRAVLAMAISNAARATELLGVTSCELDWGEQQVRVRRKGSDSEQWLPVSPDAFVWILLYLADLGSPLEPDQPLWWTLRRRDHGHGLQRQPMNYEALRAVLRRANAVLATNWSMHDLRHTCARRMARNKHLSIKDVQVILGHQHLSTTADIYLVEDDTEVIHRVRQHLADQKAQASAPPAPVADGYHSTDMDVLFGGTAE